MKKTLQEPKKLTLNKTTIAVLSNSFNNGYKAANILGGYSSTLPACDVTNTGVGMLF